MNRTLRRERRGAQPRQRRLGRSRRPTEFSSPFTSCRAGPARLSGGSVPDRAVDLPVSVELALQHAHDLVALRRHGVRAQASFPADDEAPLEGVVAAHPDLVPFEPVLEDLGAWRGLRHRGEASIERVPTANHLATRREDDRIVRHQRPERAVVAAAGCIHIRAMQSIDSLEVVTHGSPDQKAVARGGSPRSWTLRDTRPTARLRTTYLHATSFGPVPSFIRIVAGCAESCTMTARSWRRAEPVTTARIGVPA